MLVEYQGIDERFPRRGEEANSHKYWSKMKGRPRPKHAPASVTTVDMLTNMRPEPLFALGVQSMPQ